MTSIPSNIKREHIFKALEYIDENGVPSKNKPTGYIMVHNNKSYPPKHVIRIANIFANGKKLESSFSGGEQTNSFLRKLGFMIKPINNSRVEVEEFPIISYSWVVISDNYASKEADKSLFLHKSTGIPVDVRSFFSVESLKIGESTNIKIIFENEVYEAKIFMDKKSRTKLMFTSELWRSLISQFPNIHKSHEKDEVVDENPKLKFERISDIEYLINFYLPVAPEVINSDIESEIAEEESIAKSEGSIKHYFGKRYERNSVNRRNAIEIHGTVCIACGFDFEQTYGTHGKGFIEVHHLKPLNSYEGKEVKIDPYKDLIPLCANCHRMIHRNQEAVLSIEELKAIINSNRKASE